MVRISRGAVPLVACGEYLRSMKRGSVILVISLLALAMVGALGPGPVAAASKAAPKVVLIVGPAGAATDSYRRLADQAASAAAKFTPNVVRVYSPDATWTAVRQALQGASIVVYLGHGNGWPSRYRDSPYPVTQNGFGLNPTAGNGNAHQYFGEGAIGREVKLARNAVVIFSHLCYASGNSEPGLPEGPLEVGQQRVDNYAAGFVQAGASAVIADAFLGPEYYVRSILAGKGTIDRIWRKAPSYNGNLLRFASLRSKGYIAQMDTDTPTSGFHRSIVLRAGLSAANLLGSATRVIDRGVLPPLDPTIAGLGVGFDRPDLAAPPTAGTTTALTFRITATDPGSIPTGLMVGVRWDPIETEGPAAAAAGNGSAAIPPASATPRPGSTVVSPGPSSAPASAAPASGAPGLTAPVSPSAPESGDEPIPVDLVSAEVPGEVVAPVAAKRTAGGLSVPVKVPTAGGLYRLVATVHQSDGVAFDAASQALVPALIVHVTGRLTATYEAPAAINATAGKPVTLRVTVTNLGATAWGSPAVAARVGGAELQPARRATVVARWVDLASGSAGLPAQDSSSLLPPGLAPRQSSKAVLGLTAPLIPGEYLVFVDVIIPGTGSLAVAGVPPALIRVSVSGAPSQTAP
jgi:hypothetical protein